MVVKEWSKLVRSEEGRELKEKLWREVMDVFKRNRIEVSAL
jgi:hypothetical protein